SEAYPARRQALQAFSRTLGTPRLPDRRRSQGRKIAQCRWEAGKQFLLFILRQVWRAFAKDLRCWRQILISGTRILSPSVQVIGTDHRDNLDKGRNLFWKPSPAFKIKCHEL